MKQLTFEQEDYILESGLEKHRHHVQETSLEAYDLIYDDLGDMQKLVYDVIEECPNVCNQDIADILCLSINCVTPRVKELRDLFFVAHSGFKLNKLGRRVMTWRISE